MTTLGVFRDDFYNAQAALAVSQYKTSTQNGGTIVAANIAGACDCYIAFSGQTTAQSLTTDTATNIIAACMAANQAVLSPGGAGVVLGAGSSPGIPNTFNFTWIWSIINNNTTSGAITLAAGTGVTLNVGAAVAINSVVEYQITITSPSTVTIQRLASKTT